MTIDNTLFLLIILILISTINAIKYNDEYIRIMVTDIPKCINSTLFTDLYHSVLKPIDYYSSSSTVSSVVDPKMKNHYFSRGLSFLENKIRTGHVDICRAFIDSITFMYRMITFDKEYTIDYSIRLKEHMNNLLTSGILLNQCEKIVKETMNINHDMYNIKNCLKETRKKALMAKIRYYE